jgi:hypothetical protein
MAFPVWRSRLAAQKKQAIKAAVRNLRDSPLRHSICSATGRRKRSVASGYEIHYAVYPDPLGSTTSGRVEVLFVKAPYQDYSSFL